MIFWTRTKEKWFLKNGSKLLEQLIADCNGVSNPIRLFSYDQISKATNFDPKSFDFATGLIEGRSYTINKYKWFQDWGYNDIVLSARVSNHSGFLKLIGCCLQFRFPVGVFENSYGVLNKRASVGCKDSPLLPWNVRLKIAKQVAIAITYLHTAFPRIIIHKDINPENVFLDKNLNAKLSGFSISVTLPEGKTWIEDELMGSGTIRYIDPAYLSTLILTEYTDVFSFGILMLVLLMGRPAAVYGSNGVCIKILDYVKDLLERGKPIEFGGDTNDMRPGQMKMFLELALRCCAERNEDRPKMILVAKEIKLIEKSFDCNVLKTGYEREEEEERPLDLFKGSSLNSLSNRSNRGFRILLFCIFLFLLYFFETIYRL
ncbi:hypothetical protein AALP_AA5G220000 [Arabis alpina]|uniref:Protein kinase domain-containing protein n=1 Tax=Arabis alpina TaxID=50452 RepID=A0A087GYN9_ARAAL|nr:hypothetical protein AALP_AA5G220000 [Arabis alpina]